MKKKPEINVRLCTVMDTCNKYFGNNPNIVQMMPDAYYEKVKLLEYCKFIDMKKLFSGAMLERLEHGIVVIGIGLYFNVKTQGLATYVLWDDRNEKFSIIEWATSSCMWVHYKGKQLIEFQKQFGLETLHQTVLHRGLPTK